MVLDIGVLLLGLAALSFVYHLAFDVPFTRPRYTPPSPDMDWGRVGRSLAIIAGLFALSAIGIASTVRATPGMVAFYLRVRRNSNGQRLSFLRAWGWSFTGFAPLILANELVLISVKMQLPLLHWGLLNSFALLLLLQVAIYVPVLTRRGKRALHDILWDVKIDHFDVHPEGPTFLQKIFHGPFLVLVLLQMLIVGGWAALNLTDRPLDTRLVALTAQAPQDLAPLIATWRNRSGFDIAVKLPDFRCASRHAHYRAIAICPTPQEAQGVLSAYRGLIDAYRRDMLTASPQRIENVYLTQESVALTDLFLADLILQIEGQDPQPQAVFVAWLQAASFWRTALLQPGFLSGKSKIIIHYNHILSALPILLRAWPQAVLDYGKEIDLAVADLVFGQNVIDGIMAHEYVLYENLLQRSLVGYFPFIQPNATRNQFTAALEIADDLFIHPDLMARQRAVFAVLQPMPLWLRVYNPLGTLLAELSLTTFTTNVGVISTFHQNNALKKMLRLAVQARRLGIPHSQMNNFLKNIAPEFRTVFFTQSIEWDAQDQVFFYTMPGLSGFRRVLIF
ncbi:MAG: RDD family protein [Alphaproteobacteria bacterium]|nr:RDD family protein [Alphaproteobacteria bacterium]